MARRCQEDKTIRQKAQPGVSRPRAGRPTRAQQRQRVEELLSVALDTFLEHGFDQATIEEIATRVGTRSEEHTSELQSLMRISYAGFCSKKQNTHTQQHETQRKHTH